VKPNGEYFTEIFLVIEKCVRRVKEKKTNSMLAMIDRADILF